MIARLILHALMAGLLIRALATFLPVPGIQLVLSPFVGTGLITGSLAITGGLHRHQGLAIGSILLAILLSWPVTNASTLLQALLPVALGLVIGIGVRAVIPQKESE
jgi:hypothetical protein